MDETTESSVSLAEVVCDFLWSLPVFALLYLVGAWLHKIRPSAPPAAAASTRSAATKATKPSTSDADAKRKAEEAAASKRKAEEAAVAAADAKRKQEEAEAAERKAAQHAQAEAKAAAEAKRKAEEEEAAAAVKRKADDEEAEAKAAAAAKHKADEEAAAAAKLQQEAEAAAAEAKRKADEAAEEAKRMADKEAAADAKRKADEEAAAEAKHKADEDAAEAKRKADEEAAAAEEKRKADEEEAEAKRQAYEKAAEAKRKADALHKQEVEEAAAAEKQKADQEAAHKRKQEEEDAVVAKHKADEEAAEARRKADEDAADAKRKQEEEEAAEAKRKADEKEEKSSSSDSDSSSSDSEDEDNKPKSWAEVAATPAPAEVDEDKSQQVPVAVPVDTPVDTPVDAPVDTPVDAPADAVTDEGPSWAAIVSGAAAQAGEEAKEASDIEEKQSETPAAASLPASGLKGLDRLRYGLGSIQGKRPSMEDAHVTLLGMEANKQFAFFGVYDGHAGGESSEYIGENLHKAIDKKLAAIEEEEGEQLAMGEEPFSYETKLAKRREGIVEVFSRLDDELQEESEMNYWYSGSTVVTALVDLSKDNERSILCANLGDSRCVLYVPTATEPVIPMSEDHKPYNPEEKARIEKSGHFVAGDRLDGTHAISRALGDFDMKGNLKLKAPEQAISNVPEFKDVRLTEQDQQFVLILACDGLWDVMSNEEAVAWVNERLATGNDLNKIATELVEYAVEIGSTDNVSAIIAVYN